MIHPNCELPSDVLGAPNCTRLNRLNASSLKLSVIFSWMGTSLYSDISQLSVPGVRRVLSVRGSLP